MNTPSEIPLTPFYEYNEPNEPIILFDGTIGGLEEAEVTGSVELSFQRRPGIEWHADPGKRRRLSPNREVSLAMHRPDGVVTMDAIASSFDDGWSNGAEFGTKETPVSSIVAHWFNLPDWNGTIPLVMTSEDGMSYDWSNRWRLEASGWQITFDARPDYKDAIKDIRRRRLYVMTHVMELHRTNGAEFTVSEAKAVLESLHVGISFALGRWAAPMLPVAFDSEGKVVWEDWRTLHCDPLDSISPGWWYTKTMEPLGELLGAVIARCSDQNKLSYLRFQMMFAIVSINAPGLVETRIINGTAGLEHIGWEKLFLSGMMNEKQYNGWQPYQGKTYKAAGRLRLLLEAAGVPVNLDPALSPSAHQFATRNGDKFDGADVVTQVRNRLVHPEGGQEAVYNDSGLLTEVWGLTRHYLVLLILHSLGYTGAYRDLRQFSGFAWDVISVPWIDDDKPPSNDIKGDDA
ncbi:hypothetical protein [Glycomyces tenuis]|uniref:hypothetical protein n=1 Tax=Glycomyces tenuis TaxID=58116 RepID=UPI0012DCFE36|nr:hypothetical protein [Glycomyces tenuis]